MTTLTDEQRIMQLERDVKSLQEGLNAAHLEIMKLRDKKIPELEEQINGKQPFDVMNIRLR